jgi:hypothetical protein
VDQYEVGTLIIDFIDSASRQLVWRGTGSRRLARSSNTAQMTQRANEAVDEILDPFPPN